MSGDWIKMRGNLWDDPRVGRICDLTGCSEAAAIGSLYWLWATADQHTEDGCMPGLSLQQIDRKTGVKGFAAALVDIEWLADDAQGVVLKHFEEHNGSSAKKRAQTAKRVANHRAGNGVETPVDPVGNAASVTDALAREEKRREEEKTTGATAPAALLAANDRKDAVFALGLPMLTTAGVEEKQARAFLGFLRKHNTDAEVIEGLKRCAVERAIQPIPFLQACLKTTKKHDNRQEAIETSNRAIGEQWAKEMQGAH